MHGWRRFLLRVFGARIGRNTKPYPTMRVWAPWNLTMDEGSVIGDGADCYSVAPISLGAGAVVSQRAFLCTASRDFDDSAMPLIAAPIVVGAKAWICAEAYVGPGIHVGDGAVVGARAVATRDVDPWTVVAGNPAVGVRARRPSHDAAREVPAGEA